MRISRIVRRLIWRGSIMLALTGALLAANVHASKNVSHLTDNWLANPSVNTVADSEQAMVPFTGYDSWSVEPIVQHYDAQGYYENRLVKDAYDETVQTGTKTITDKAAWDEDITYYICSDCGARK